MTGQAPDFHLIIPDGDDKERSVCRSCGFIDYVNPKLVAGVVATDSAGRILMCKRAIEPRHGFWTLPAGFMEKGESVEDGAAREAREEACAELELEGLPAVYSVPRISQVQMFFRARLISDIAAGPESLDVALYEWEDIPMSDLAFPTVRWALEDFRASMDLTVPTPVMRTQGPNFEPL